MTDRQPPFPPRTLEGDDIRQELLQAELAFREGNFHVALVHRLDALSLASATQAPDFSPEAAAAQLAEIEELAKIVLAQARIFASGVRRLR